MLMTMIISVLALGISAMNFWFIFLRRAKVNTFTDRTLKWVCPPDRIALSGVHVECTFINPSPKTAVINKIRLKMSGPGYDQLLEPRLFFKYDSNFDAVCDGPPHPLVVDPRDSHLENMEFGLPGTFMPQPGRYDFILNIWINRKQRPEPAYRFTMTITGEDIPRIMTLLVLANTNQKPGYFPIEIET